MDDLKDLGKVQHAVSNAIRRATDLGRGGVQNHRVGVDVTAGIALYSIGAAMAALNRGVHVVYIDGKDRYQEMEMRLDAGLFADELG